MAEQEFLEAAINPYPYKLKDFKGIVLFEEDLPSFVENAGSPVDLDLCCGNGENLVFLAERNRGRMFLGVELQYKEVYRTASKIRNRALKNARVARINAGDIGAFFRPGGVGDVSLLFPDPWPKRRQKKHRLLNRGYFDLLVSLMKKGSGLFFKTDNDDYMLQAFDCYKSSAYGNNLDLEVFTRDFHSLDVSKKYYITAFERIFLREKRLINAMLIRRI